MHGLGCTPRAARTSAERAPPHKIIGRAASVAAGRARVVRLSQSAPVV